MKPSIPVALALLALVAPVAGQSEPSGKATEDQELAKPRLSRLQGRAAVGRRNEVVGATVLVHAREDASRVYLTSSGESGAFVVDGLPDGEYRVRVARTGLSPVTKDRVSVRFPFRAVVEVTMQPGTDGTALAGSASHTVTDERIAVQGQVRGQDGEPMPEVRVRLVRIDGRVDPRSLRTGNDGRFAFPDLPAGEWRLGIQGVGFLSKRQPIDLSSDTELSVTLVRQPAHYEPSPLELMPPEQPVPPEGFGDPS